MPHTDDCLTSESLFVGRPLCPVCGEEMWLVSVLPVAPDKIKRTFQCPVCGPSPPKKLRKQEPHALQFAASDDLNSF